MHMKVCDKNSVRMCVYRGFEDMYNNITERIEQLKKSTVMHEKNENENMITWPQGIA